jgi:diguanylate cyclase (GGDEF)-like protein
MIRQMVADPEPAKRPAKRAPEKTFQELVLALNAALQKNELALIELDTALRSTETPALADVSTNSRELQARCENYLAEMGKIADQLRTQIPDLGSLKVTAKQLDAALGQEMTRVGTSISTVDQLDLTSDPASTTEQLRSETISLSSALHVLRDSTDRIYMASIWEGQNLKRPENTPTTDSLTNSLNRLGMELTLQDRWSTNYFRDHTCCAILLDLDGFVGVNQEFGLAAGKHVLQAVCDRIRTCLGPEDLLFRYSGQQIAVLLSGVTSAAGMKTARQISETVQARPVPYGASEIHVGMTGTVIQIMPANNPRMILGRLEDGLTKAKRIKRGGIFLSDNAQAPPQMLKEPSPEEA